MLVRIGPLVLRIQADDRPFADAFGALYAEYNAAAIETEVADITLQLRRAAPGRFIWLFNGLPIDRPQFPAELVFANFEWGIHFAIATSLAPSISFHGSVTSQPDGRTVALVGSSGSGKSTLAAGLMAGGWNLLADEFLVVSPGGELLPLPAPITLKNQSIALIRELGGPLVFGPVARDEARGELAHVSSSHALPARLPSTLDAIVFPTFAEGESTTFVRVDQPTAFQFLVVQSHNRHVLGPDGFRLLAEVARTPAWVLRFSILAEGLAAVRSSIAAPV